MWWHLSGILPFDPHCDYQVMMKKLTRTSVLLITIMLPANDLHFVLLFLKMKCSKTFTYSEKPVPDGGFQVAFIVFCVYFSFVFGPPARRIWA